MQMLLSSDVDVDAVDHVSVFNVTATLRMADPATLEPFWNLSVVFLPSQPL